MLGIFIKRALSSLFMVAGWVVAVVRSVLDLIGWSTAPDDMPVAMSRLDQFFLWLLSLPWWVPWGFALVSTLWLMWVSWPRSVLVANTPSMALSESDERAATRKPKIERPQLPAYSQREKEALLDEFFQIQTFFHDDVAEIRGRLSQASMVHVRAYELDDIISVTVDAIRLIPPSVDKIRRLERRSQFRAVISSILGTNPAFLLEEASRLCEDYRKGILLLRERRADSDVERFALYPRSVAIHYHNQKLYDYENAINKKIEEIRKAL